MGITCTDIRLPPKSVFNLKFRIIVSTNACAARAALARCKGLGAVASGADGPARTKGGLGIVTLARTTMLLLGATAQF